MGKAGDFWNEAHVHLAAADPVLARLIQSAGPCGMRPRRDYFPSLCRAIFAQQVSTGAARTIGGRFKSLFERGKPTPQGVLLLNEEQLATVGISRQKCRYIRDLADHFASGRVPTRRLGRMSDEEIILSLTQVKGVGVWTAQMFLMFVMCRPDVLPVDDLGLRKGFQKAYGLRTLPVESRMTRISEAWRPWRSVGSWYMWRAAAM
jgi:DNA-3-methyladenine glycosylase II